MSALARYFLHEGRKVAGYDRTPTPLTHALEQEGAQVCYADEIENIPADFRNPATTMVVFTPAVPSDHPQMRFFSESGFLMEKRSQMLGHLSEGKYVMAVAGTHGKTTTSTLVAWLNHRAAGCGKAVLGGISKNFASNLVLGEGRRMTVEADEFDRSFLRLTPDVAVITSADADHLDIYGTHEAVKEAFSQFVDRINAGGTLIIKKGVDIAINNQNINVFRYSYDEPCDFYATNISTDEGGYYTFDLQCPDGVLPSLRLGIPGWVNVENAVAAVAMLWAAAKAENRALDLDELRAALNEFSGVKRRFEFYVNTPKQVYMDDYAHHPRELGAAISSVRAMFPTRHLTALFQPHLYTRTRDLCDGFAEALSMADEVVLLPIYPARELPIEGVTAELIAERLTAPYRIVELDALADEVAAMTTDVVVSFGAGSIDRKTAELAAVAEAKSH